MAKTEKPNGMAIINNQIKEENYSKLYLLTGSEDYLVDQYRDKLVSKLTAPDDTMNYIVYKGENAKVEAIIEFADTMPFFADRRVVLVEDSGFFKKGNEKLEPFLEVIPDTTVLIFVEKEIDNRIKLTKQVAKYGTVAVFDAPDDRTLLIWLNGLFGQENLSVDGATLRYLLDRVGNDMNLLVNEVKKLSAYCMDKGSVTRADVDKLSVSIVEDKIFEMMDALAEKKREKMMTLYDDLLTLREAPMKILALIARHFMILLKVQFALSSGTAEYGLASELKIPPYFVKKYIAQSKRFTYDQLLNCNRLCQDTDSAIKSGRMRDKLAVEMLILELLLHDGKKQEV